VKGEAEAGILEDNNGIGRGRNKYQMYDDRRGGVLTFEIRAEQPILRVPERKDSSSFRFNGQTCTCVFRGQISVPGSINMFER
jgi:hypothetical protein